MAYNPSLINTCKTYYSFNKQPAKLGEVIEVSSKKVMNLIIAIKKYEYDASTNAIAIEYITQILGNDYDNTACGHNHMSHAVGTFQGYFQYACDNPSINSVKLGEMTWVEKKGVYARVVDYTGVEWVGTNVKIGVVLQPIYPIQPELAKKKYKEVRKSHFILI